MALGANRSQILSLILRQSAGLLAVGLAAGAILTIAAGQTVKSLLFGLQPNDAGTLALAILLLAIVTQAASYLPPRRAALLDPRAALGEEWGHRESRFLYRADSYRHEKQNVRGSARAASHSECQLTHLRRG